MRLAGEPVPLSPAEWSRSILPNLFPLDKGVHLKIEPLPQDFKLVMETAFSLAASPLRGIMRQCVEIDLCLL